MPILEGASEVKADNTNILETGRDMFANRAYDCRLDGHNFAGPTNYHQHGRDECNASILAEMNDQVNLNTNIVKVEGNININYMERNPHVLQSLINTFTAMFSYFQKTGSSIPPVDSEDLTTCSVTEMHLTSNEESEVVETSIVGETILTSFPNYESGSLPSETQVLFKKVPVSCEVYLENMLPLRNGYSLWFPQPAQDLPWEYRRKGVSIGDVGVITRGGSFDFLFNVLLSSRNPMNIPASLPDNYNSGLPPKLHTISQRSLNPGESSISSFYIESEVDLDTK